MALGTVRQSETRGEKVGGGGLDDSSPLSWIPRAAISLCVRLSDSTCAVRTLPSGRLTAEGFIAKCSQMVSPPTSVDLEWAELQKKKKKSQNALFKILISNINLALSSKLWHDAHFTVSTSALRYRNPCAILFSPSLMWRSAGAEGIRQLSVKVKVTTTQPFYPRSSQSVKTHCFSRYSGIFSLLRRAGSSIFLYCKKK